jgi:hypothetical protein
VRNDARRTAAARGDDVSHDATDTVLIEQAVHQTVAEQLLGFAFCPFGDFHV